MKTFIKSVILYLLLTSFSFSQGPGSAAVPFVLIGPSPALGSDQAASAVFPTDDAFGFYYNPAQLGVFGSDNNFAVQFYTEKTQLLPQYHFDDFTYNSYVFNGGYIVKDFFDEIDLNIGIGYMRTVLNLGTSVITDVEGNETGTFNSSESYNTYAIGLGFKYYAWFSLGYSYKKINSDLAPAGIQVGTETTDGKAESSAYDIGILVSIPAISTEDEISLMDMDLVSDLYFGYAIVNNGDFISYTRNDPGDPLPKTARWGAGFSLGLSETYGSYNVKTVEVQLANEANDLLVERSGAKRQYQDAPGDINFFDNILFGNSDDLVQVQNSIKINIFEAIQFGFHKMKGPGFSRFVHNTSFMISASGILKIFAQDFYEDYGRFVDIRYSRCDIDARDSAQDQTKYQAIAIHLRNLFGSR